MDSSWDESLSTAGAASEPFEHAQAPRPRVLLKRAALWLDEPELDGERFGRRRARPGVPPLAVDPPLLPLWPRRVGLTA